MKRSQDHTDYFYFFWHFRNIIFLILPNFSKHLIHLQILLMNYLVNKMILIHENFTKIFNFPFRKLLMKLFLFLKLIIFQKMMNLFMINWVYFWVFDFKLLFIDHFKTLQGTTFLTYWKEYNFHGRFTKSI